MLMKSKIFFLNAASTTGWPSGNVKEISTFPAAIEVTATELKTAGFSTESFAQNCYKYYFIAIKGSVTYGILVQVKSAEVSADKTALNNEIAKVTGDNAANWYQSGDRYNGDPACTITDVNSGFWAEMQSKLYAAQTIAENKGVNQSTVDTATAQLAESISKLIPTSQINATALYEALQGSKRIIWSTQDGVTTATIASENYNDPTYITQQDTTPATWSALQAAVTQGQNLLDSLFDKDGRPTEKNTSADAALVAEVGSTVTAIQEAIRNLDRRAADHELSDSELALQGIDLYANTLYDPAKLSESDYTPESWSAFIKARTAALAVLESDKTFAGMGSRVVVAETKAFNDLRTACYGLTETADTVTVHFSAVDSAAVRKGEVQKSMAVQTGDLKLSAGRTIADALAQAGVAFPTSGRGNTVQGVYLNGVFLTKDRSVSDQAPASNASYYKNYVLRDGDTLTAVLMAPPLYTNLSNETAPQHLIDIDPANHPRYQTVQAAAGVQTAGKAFTVTVTADGALATNRTGTPSPVKGAAIYVSEVCQTEEEARTAVLTKATGVTTGADGTASVKLYTEGWYALNAFDLSDNGGLLNGPTILVQVGASGDESAVKTELKSELEALAKKHPENFYTPEDWQKIQDAKAAALAAINAAESTGAAYSAQQEAVTTITAIQTAADKENTSNLKSFRYYMSDLPEDLEKLDQSAQDAVNSLITRYDRMTGYQREQLSQREIDRYEQIKARNEAGLPPAVAYQLKVEYDLSGVPEEDRETLQAMLTYLQEHTAYEGKNDGNLGGEKMAELYSFNTRTNSASMGGSVFTPVTESYGGQEIKFCKSPEYASHMLIRGQRNYTVNGQKYNNTNYNDTLTGEGWSIQDTSTVDRTDMKFDLHASRVYTVNGHTYEMRGVRVDGVDAAALTSTKYGFFDFSDYLGKNTSNQTFISIADSFDSFTMPYNDVTVTVTWAPAGGTSDEIVSAKAAAKSAIETAFAGYSQSNYTDGNWEKLTKAKDDGLAAVEAAATLDAVKTARQNAIAAMAAVPKKSGGSTTPPVDLPDYGKTVGQVYVSVENSTYPGGAFTGTIVSGWYDLCEQDTMMTSILKALKTDGFSWSGTGGSSDPWTITYIASISKDDKKLGEFDGEPGSGWMGTLNDWFTNEGFSSFGVENGKLKSGDIIHVVYTQNLGEDVGGSWNNSDTSLKALTIDGGTLSPGFNGSTTEYTLTIPGTRANVTVTPTAANKNYLVKTFLNTYDSDAAFYSRTETISVKPGDVIYVGVGEKSWPSMNNQGDEARDYTGTKYVIHVYGADADSIQARINALPDAGKITSSNYKDYAETVAAVRKAYEALSDKSGINTDKLTAAEAAIQKFQEIDHVKSLLAALPSSSSATDAQVKAAKSDIEATDKAYKALSDEQKGYITIADYKNYNDLVERLSKLTHTSAGSISKNPNEEAASEVIGLISAIGTVTKDSGSKIQAARSAYDKLTDAQKKLVSNYKVLTDAEAAYAKLINSGLAFTDVKESDYFYDAVKWAVEKEITKGTTETTFSPNEGCTRSQMVTFLWRAAGSPEPTGTINPFTDVKTDAYYYKALLWAIENGITNGTTDTTFSPEEICTRGQMATFLYRNAKSPAVTGSTSFTDVAADAYYSDAVVWAFQQGITKGATDTTFEPDETCTRGQMVTFLYRYLGK